MRTIKKLIIPKGEDIRTEATGLIMERLGIVKAAIFFRETMSQSVDYLKLKETLFDKKSSKALYNEIKNFDHK